MNRCVETIAIASLIAAIGLFSSATASPVISEFLALNVDSHLDGDGNPSDWIEIWNDSEQSLSLEGWALSDDPDLQNRWPLPPSVLPPDGRLLVYASGQETIDYVDSKGGAHTNFKLTSSPGGYLTLINADEQIVHAYEGYPEQHADRSYGLDESGKPVFFRAPTPESPNGNDALLGFVADTKFSVDRGFFTEPFYVVVTSESQDALIRYTTDGSTPTIENGLDYPGDMGIRIETTTTLRAAAFKEGFESSNVDTQSYIFPTSVVNQPSRPEGFPTSWRGWDYEMDQDADDLPLIAGDENLSIEEAKAVIAESLRSLPAISIVMNVDDLFGSPNGIYYNTQGRGDRWERAASMEIIHPKGGSENYQVDCGIRIQGFTSRDPDRNPKHSLRLVFRKAYGAAEMRYPLFGEDAAREFDTVVLRSNSQDAWVYNSAGNRLGQFVRDEWNRQTQLRMGRPAAHGTWVHLFLNGLYWGVYNPTERPDANFMASYFGAESEDYDILKNHEEVIDGTRNAYRELLGLVQKRASNFASGYNDFSSNTAYQRVQGNDPDGSANPDLPDYIDVPNLIDYMIHNMYSAAEDWPGNNYIGRLRGPQSSGFHFFSWDNEHGMKGSVREDRTRPHGRDSDSPTKFHHPLTDNAEYRLLFADHLHRAIVAKDGVLYVDPEHSHWDPNHPERNRPAALWIEITGQIEEALIAESARWGDYRRNRAYTVHKDFESLRDGLLRNWFPDRSRILLDQFRKRGLYPDVEAPVFNQNGGTVPQGFGVVLSSASEGEIYYTVDGSDPRSTGGKVVPTARLFEGDVDQVHFLTGSRSPNASVWNYLDTGDLSGQEWTTLEFDDTGWKSGFPEFGYGDRDEATIIEFGDDIFNKRITSYFRTTWDVADASRVQKLSASIKFDDGVVVYLNGSEVFRGNLPEGVISPDTLALQKGDEKNYTDFSLDSSALIDGRNVVAVEIHQLNRSDSDLSFDFDLTADILKDTADVIRIEGLTRVRSRVLGSGGEWSAMNEGLFLAGVPPSDKNLVISEIMYHPKEHDSAEFVELLNTGNEAIDMTRLRLAGGVFFAFARGEKLLLPAGQRILVVRDRFAMEAVYGPGIQSSIAGEFQYGTGLSNSGEALRLEEISGQVILTLNYDDKEPWPKEADGGGYSLVLASPSGSGNLSDGRNWRTSESQGGTPGTGDTVATTYTSWQLANGVGAPGEDADGDGRSNLFEYAVGTNPNLVDPYRSSMNLEHTQEVNGIQMLEVSFEKSASAIDVIVALEVSNDLVSWSDGTPVFGKPQIIEGSDNRQTIRYRAAVTEGNRESLVRLRISLR